MGTMWKTMRAVVLCLLYVMHAAASQHEPKDEMQQPYLLEMDLSCNNGIKNPTVERTVTKLGEICNWQLSVSNKIQQVTLPTTQLSQGYYLVTVGFSTSGSLLLTHNWVKNDKETLLNNLTEYKLTLTSVSGSTGTVIPAPGKKLTIDINSVKFPTASLPCGIALLAGTIEYVNVTKSSSTNPKIEFIPINIKCEEEALDLAVELLPQKNATIQYGKPLNQQIRDLTIGIRNKGKSTFLSRTGMSQLQVWAYLRRQENQYQRRPPTKAKGAAAMHLTIHDVILHEGNRLVDTKKGENSPAIQPNGLLTLKVDELMLKEPTVCGNATLIVMVDPISGTNDKIRDNNVATLPIYVNCSNGDNYFKHTHCSVISDDINLGKRAVMSFIQYSGMSFYNHSRMFSSIHPYMKDYVYKDETRGFSPMNAQEDTKRIIATLNQLLVADTDRLKQTGRCETYGQQFLHGLKESSKKQTLLWMGHQFLIGFRSFWNALQDRININDTWQREEHKKIALLVDIATDVIGVAANKEGPMRDFIYWVFHHAVKMLTGMRPENQYNRHMNTDHFKPKNMNYQHESRNTETNWKKRKNSHVNYNPADFKNREFRSEAEEMTSHGNGPEFEGARRGPPRHKRETSFSMGSQWEQDGSDEDDSQEQKDWRDGWDEGDGYDGKEGRDGEEKKDWRDDSDSGERYGGREGQDSQEERDSWYDRDRGDRYDDSGEQDSQEQRESWDDWDRRDRYDGSEQDSQEQRGRWDDWGGGWKIYNGTHRDSWKYGSNGSSSDSWNRTQHDRKQWDGRYHWANRGNHANRSQPDRRYKYDRQGHRGYPGKYGKQGQHSRPMYYHRRGHQGRPGQHSRPPQYHRPGQQGRPPYQYGRENQQSHHGQHSHRGPQGGWRRPPSHRRNRWESKYDFNESDFPKYGRRDYDDFHPKSRYDPDEAEDDISSGLRALLMQKELPIRGAPSSIRKGIPLFFKKLLWDQNLNEAEEMSGLPIATLKKIRQAIEMVLNGEMPTLFNFPKQFRERLRRANIFERTILPRLAMPFKADTIVKILDSFLDFTEQYFRNKDNIPDQIQLINTTIIALKQNRSLLESFANIVKRIQASFIVDDSLMILNGKEGDFPSEDMMCRMFIGSYLWKKLKIHSLPNKDLLDSLDIETSSGNPWPTFWKSESDGIMRGDYSELTGKFYWTKVAMCSCEHKCPQSYHRG